jgi:hypothetical protein
MYDIKFTAEDGKCCNVSSTANGFTDSMLMVLFDVLKPSRQLLTSSKFFNAENGEWTKAPSVSIRMGTAILANLNRMALFS